MRENGIEISRKFSATVEGFKHGRVETDTVERYQMRLRDGPLDRLAARKLLAPGDPTLNASLFAAGDRFRMMFHQTGLNGVGAIDPSKPLVSGSTGGGLLRTDRQITAWQRYTAASGAIPEQCRPRRGDHAV